MIAPSLHSLAISGFLLLFIVILLIQNFSSFMRLGFYQKASLLSLVCAAVGIHGLVHLGVAAVYDLNPYRWFK